MAQNDYADGWGVVDDSGLDVRSVSPTRRAAMVNWLVATAGVFVHDGMSDDLIERMFASAQGDAILRPVRIYVQ